MASFSSPQPLLDLVAGQKRGLARGIPSVCSAHRRVLEAAMLRARADAAHGGLPLLLEATCNQVNQYGGYTGLTPAGFAAYAAQVAQEMGLEPGRVLLGGDHLGPNPWRKESAAGALDKAAAMVKAYVQSGFRKIHLDASMLCADDRELPAEEIAARAAGLCAAAESAAAGAAAPVYVIGTEVPPPGGAKGGAGLEVTRPEDALETIELFRRAFRARGLESAWERVIALVVQPGVEFGDASIHPYRREQAAALSRAIEGVAGMIYEAHSTDYQTPAALRALVEDHFAILKVGPALTFAYREALFALAQIEEEQAALYPEQTPAGLFAVLEETMLADPRDWQDYYRGSPPEQAFARRYSLSDRVRYYWLREPLQGAVARLEANLTRRPPAPGLLSQHLPLESRLVQQGRLENTPAALARAHIQAVLEDYSRACAAG